MKKTTLGLIGVGAFGALAGRHLASHFDMVLHDAKRDIASLAREFGARVGDLKQAASCDILVLAVPVQTMESVLSAVAPWVKQGALVLDVASVKTKPADLMLSLLPDSVDIIGTHPLFGPQSGKDSIEGLNMALCNLRGNRAACVSDFLQNKLKLNVQPTTPQEHDKEMAYVQGLTHLLAKVVVSLDLPKFKFTTKTYDYMDQMVEMIRYDSDDLFKAIARENPFSGEAKKAFFAAARRLEEKLD